jgi:hypothetical protein
MVINLSMYIISRGKRELAERNSNRMLEPAFSVIERQNPSPLHETMMVHIT